jgi:hypothetical protein
MNVTMAQEVAVRAAVRAATRKEIKDVDVDRIVEAALATRPALTRSERELHDLMTRMFQARRRLSTLREIRDESRWASSGNVHRTMQRLVEKGYVTRFGQHYAPLMEPVEKAAAIRALAQQEGDGNG